MNIFRQLRYGLAGGGSKGVEAINLTRPLLISKPIKFKRERAEGASIVHDPYACARYMRKKLLKVNASGKQQICAFDSGLYGPVGFASHVENERIALEARVLLKQLPAPQLPDCIGWIEKNIDELLPSIHKVVPVPFNEYIRRVGSSPGVIKNLVAAHERLTLAGISCHSTLTPQQVHAWTKRSSFVKVENLSYHSPLGLKEKAPRLIQGAQAEFVVLVGPWIMALQDLVSRRWRPSKSNFVFTSGVTSIGAAKHVLSVNGQHGYDDIGTFDLDQSRPWGFMFHRLCKKWGAPEATLQLIHGNIDTHGKTHHGWKYKCRGTRKSGDPYTSLFNTMINVFSHAYLYHEFTGKEVSEMRDSFVMIAQGDDNAFSHVESERFPWREGMLRLGFDSEATYGSKYDLEFCSMRLYETNLGWTFGPKPGKVLSRLGYAINKPHHVSFASYARGVVKSQISTFGFIPILKVVYDRILELTAHVEGEEFYPRDWVEHKLRMPTGMTAARGMLFALNESYYWTSERMSKFSFHVKKMKLGEAWPTWIQQLLFDRDTDGIKVTYSR
jgi:hypothetical protein